MYCKDFSQGQKEVGYLQNAPLPPKNNSLPKTGYGFSEFDLLGFSVSIPVLGNLRGKGKNTYPREESVPGLLSFMWGYAKGLKCRKLNQIQKVIG